MQDSCKNHAITNAKTSLYLLHFWQVYWQFTPELVYLNITIHARVNNLNIIANMNTLDIMQCQLSMLVPHLGRNSESIMQVGKEGGITELCQ